MSIQSRITQIEDALARRYDERRKLNEQVQELSRQIDDLEEQITYLEVKRDFS